MTGKIVLSGFCGCHTHPESRLVSPAEFSHAVIAHSTTSVSHDSHNIICVDANDGDIALAVNRVTENHGGIVVVKNGAVLAELPLEIAGLMSDKPLGQVNALLENAKETAYTLGVGKDIHPFMTLSFMSLPVIPTLRLTTRGVLDVITQQYI